ncbi:MAG: nuclear transport factor 2 family protein [Steroidobacteraceae bacterium]
MPTYQQSSEIGRTFWDSFIAGDIDTFASLLADDVVRLGPRDGNPDDVIRGKQPYVKFIRDIKATMPAHGGRTGVVGASPDGSWAFVHCIEVVATSPGSTKTVDVSNVLMMRINAAGLIDEIDIFRKEPSEDIGWTKATELMDASQRIRR